MAASLDMHNQFFSNLGQDTRRERNGMGCLHAQKTGHFFMISPNSAREERIVRHPRHDKLNFMEYTTVKRSRIPRKLENLLTNKVCSTSTLFSRTRVRRAARQ